MVNTFNEKRRVRFAVYGAGYRGGRLLNFLGREKVITFIDSNPNKIGKTYNEIPIIDIDEYQNRYDGINIIVTPIDYKSIENELDQRGISCYSNLNELPSEFSGYGGQKFYYCYEKIIKKYKKPCYVYGRNAFSLLLYEAIRDAGNNVSMIKDRVDEKEGIIFVTADEDTETLCKKFAGFQIIDAYDYSNNLPVYFNNSLFRLKNKYKYKKRCFIVATGPSLQQADLNKLYDMKEFSISMNRIYNIESLWMPDVYVAVDSVLLNEDRKKISQFNVPLKIYSDSTLAPDRNGLVVHVVSTNCKNFPRFSEEFAQKAYGGCTVTYVCLQLAVYLGFKEIYLLGVDCNYIQASKNNYFYEVEDEDKYEHNVEGMVLAYESAKKYAEEHGIKIYNATRGGKLEVFERVDLDTLF